MGPKKEGCLNLEGLEDNEQAGEQPLAEGIKLL